MLFNLEPGGVGYSDKHRLATVKVNDEEGRNLPAEIYYIDDSQHFSIHHFRNLSSYRVSSSFQDLRLKVEKVKGDYKLALISRSNNSYYYYNNSTMLDLCRNEERCTLPEQNRVLIDPKDIISSENIIAILEELERYNDMLEIQIGEKAASDAGHNVNIYNPFTRKMIGVMNNIVPYFYESAHQRYTLILHTLYQMNGREKENSYFTAKKLGNNYVGCISYENSTCKNFYNLNPDSFGYEHDNSPGPYPYYYNLENFGNFLEVDLNTKEYTDIEEKVKYLEQQILSLQADIRNLKYHPQFSGQKGNAGIPGQKGERGQVGNPGLPGYQGHKGEQGISGLPGQKGEPGLGGRIGPIGPPGLTGIKGERGQTGLHGYSGRDGAPGEKGDRGPKGDKGEPGRDGVPGVKGESGILGQKGEIGAPGMPGLDGKPAAFGDKGDIGPKGADGLQGIKGEKGNTSNAREIATELVTSKKAELGEAVLNAKDIRDEDLATQVAGKISFNTKEFVNKIDVAKLTEGVVSKLSLEGAKKITEDTVNKIVSDATQKNNPDPMAFQKYEKFAEKLAELVVDRSSMSEKDANTLIKDRISDWGLAKYLLLNSGLNKQTEALDTVKQEINKEKLIEHLLGYAELKGNVGATKTIIENIVHQFLDTQKVGELGRAVLEAKDDQDKKVLINDPVLREGIAEELRQNPGKIKGPKGDAGTDGLPGAQGLKGEPGIKGEPGLMGFNGTQGLTGNKGEPGIDGLKGDIGLTGPQGIQGPAGSRGEKGGDTIFKEVVEKLINNRTIANQVLECRDQDGDLVLEKQLAGRIANDQDIQTGIAIALADNRMEELADVLLSDANHTLVENLANNTELTQSIAEELRKNPGEVQGPKGEKGDIGPKGLEGAMGIKGDRGEKGEIGSKGEKGGPGANGLQGPKGSDGLPGPKGEIGLQGPKGQVGRSGLKGSKGVTLPRKSGEKVETFL